MKMIINSGTIREAFQSFNTVFNKAFQEMEAQYPRVAMEVPSETRDESYAWLGAVPSMLPTAKALENCAYQFL